LRENTEPPAYTPLVTATNTSGGGVESAQVNIVTATSDLTHLVLTSNTPLLPLAGSPTRSLYLWSGGTLAPISVLPSGEYADTGTLGSGAGSLQHGISEDGSRAFWSLGQYTEFGNGVTALYLRDTEAEETVRLDVVQGGTGLGAAHPTFQGASANGTVVFFTDSQQLTADANPDGTDLYRCEIPAGAASAGCSGLTDVTAGSGESAKVQGLISGMSADGNAVYFVAKGVLDGASNEFGDSAQAGRANLYLWKQGHGVRFIATLSRTDERDWGGENELAFEMSSAPSPSGRYLSFASQRSLTGEENLDAASDQPVERVFRYDADAARLECISCNPTGAGPLGFEGEMPLVDRPKSWREVLVGATLPHPSILSGGAALVPYFPRSVLDNGRVFFDSYDSLVPADSNGEWDVYQFEPLGVGDCEASSGSAAIARSGGGCVSLISSGTGESEAAFLDAGETGDDVFFLTRAQLNELDEDQEVDVYDARVNGVPATRPSHTECLGEACQPVPAAPNDPTPASAAFEGEGNVVARHHRCSRGKKRVRRHGHSRCVPRKHRKHGHKGQAKSARRAGR
jgi:hypothetical protein